MGEHDPRDSADDLLDVARGQAYDEGYANGYDAGTTDATGSAALLRANLNAVRQFLATAQGAEAYADGCETERTEALRECYQTAQWIASRLRVGG